MSRKFGLGRHRAAILVVFGLFASLDELYPATVALEDLKSFGFEESSGKQPTSDLIEGSNGTLYGLTAYGGGFGSGTLFQVNKDGSGYRNLRSFEADSRPYASLVEASDGRLYGVAGSNIFGINKDGSDYGIVHALPEIYSAGGLLEGSDGRLYGNSPEKVFRVNRDGSGFQVIKSFAGTVNGPVISILVEGAEGRIYGTTGSRASTGGSVFRVSKDGAEFSTLHVFGTAPEEEKNPARLAVDAEGMIYGITTHGGPGNYGGIFKLHPNTGAYTPLHQFRNFLTDGYLPNGITVGNDGYLYGSTFVGGEYGSGLLFRIRTDGTGYQFLHSATNGVDANPWAPPLRASDGLLYGMTMDGDGVIYRMEKSGSNFTVLRRLSLAGGDGRNPNARLMQGGDGTWYGTTAQGGTNDGGVVFRMASDGSDYRILHHAQGGLGQIEPAVDADGFVYVTTYRGGTNGLGTLVKIAPDGTEATVLRHFGYNGGGILYAGVTLGPGNLLYGTTYTGGGQGSGTIFRIDRDGSDYTVLHDFGGSKDGHAPLSRLLVASDGALYGTTETNGTVYKVNADGSGYAVLRRFSNVMNGNSPGPMLLEGIDGFIYGVTKMGGTNSAGTVFRLRKDGSDFSTVCHLNSPVTGGYPWGLVQGRDGQLYGTATYGGGTAQRGTIFVVNPANGACAAIYTFPEDGSSDPTGSLAEGSDGTLVGASLGGSMDLGRIYRLIVPSLTRLAVRKQEQTVTLNWAAVPGLTYQIQTKSAAEGSWSNSGEGIVPTNSAASRTDVIGTENRFYRVVTSD